MASPAPPIACLALDIGGVICGGIWEGVVDGVFAAQGKIDRAALLAHGRLLWQRYSRSSAHEDDYWRDWQPLVGDLANPARLKAWRERHVWVDGSTATLAERCLDAGIAVCLVPNSASFWYDWVLQASGLDAPGPRLDRAYPSHETGHPKDHPQGGLALLAATRAPGGILFVDDRRENILAAHALGIQACLYRRQAGRALNDALQPLLF